MAVVYVRELHTKRSSATRDGVTTHRRAWRVRTDDKNDGTAVALTADDGLTAVDAYGATFAGCALVDVEAKPEGDSLYDFVVEAEYSSATNFTQQAVHPLSRPVEISYGSAESTAPYFLDESTGEDGRKPVVNSAGDTFQNELQRECGEMTITITRNEAAHNADLADDYSHTINAAPVTIDGSTYAARTLKLSPIQAVKTTERFNGQDVTYYRKTYTLKRRRGGWDDKVLDTGLNVLTEDGRPQPILDAAGLPVRKPWPLNGAGVAKPLADDRPEELTFKPYKAQPIGTLNFPA